jgi:hypothetical protein
MSSHKLFIIYGRASLTGVWRQIRKVISKLIQNYKFTKNYYKKLNLYLLK